MYWLIALFLTVLYYIIIYKWDKRRQAAYKMAQQLIPSNLPDSTPKDANNTTTQNQEMPPIPRTVFGETTKESPTESSEKMANNAIKQKQQERPTRTDSITAKTIQTNTANDESTVSETVELLGTALISKQSKEHKKTSFPK